MTAVSLSSTLSNSGAYEYDRWRMSTRLGIFQRVAPNISRHEYFAFDEKSMHAKNPCFTVLHIINKSWGTCTQPQIWKYDNLTPILTKDKPKSKVSSYRPMSPTSCICKIMDCRRLYWWLEKSGKLHKNQACFRKGRQTIDQLIRLAQQTVDALSAVA